MDLNSPCPNHLNGCLAFFNRPKDLEKHIENCFYGNCICPTCGVSVLLKNLGKHITQCSTNRNRVTLECVYCQGQFNSAELELHRVQCNSKPHSCQFCGLGNFKKSELSEHVLKCPKVGKPAYSRNVYSPPKQSVSFMENPTHSSLNQQRSSPNQELELKEYLDHFQSRLNKFENTLFSLEKKVDKIEVSLNDRCTNLEKDTAQNKRRTEAVENTLFEKYCSIEGMCTGLENRISSINGTITSSTTEIATDVKPTGSQSVKINTTLPREERIVKKTLDQIIDSFFPKNLNTTFRKMIWDVYIPEKYVSGLWDERWFNSDGQDYEYRCYIFSNDTQEQLDIKVWLGFTNNLNLFWPPQMTVLLGILDGSLKEKEVVLRHRILESPRKFNEVYKEGSGYFLFDNFVAFKELELSETKFLQGHYLKLVLALSFIK